MRTLTTYRRCHVFLWLTTPPCSRQSNSYPLSQPARGCCVPGTVERVLQYRSTAYGRVSTHPTSKADQHRRTLSEDISEKIYGYECALVGTITCSLLGRHDIHRSTPWFLTVEQTVVICQVGWLLFMIQSGVVEPGKSRRKVGQQTSTSPRSPPKSVTELQRQGEGRCRCRRTGTSVAVSLDVGGFGWQQVSRSICRRSHKKAGNQKACSEGVSNVSRLYLSHCVYSLG